VRQEADTRSMPVRLLSQHFLQGVLREGRSHQVSTFIRTAAKDTAICPKSSSYDFMSCTQTQNIGNAAARNLHLRSTEG
jgi:hypothetical protein